MSVKPIKRIQSLLPLSREHHHSLLLSWKIRRGFSLNIPAERIKKYVDWFFENHIKKHFKFEEKYVFPVLGEEDELRKRALAEHRRLERLFTDQSDIVRSLSLIEEELESHIRFEERILFKEIQNVASPGMLKQIEEMHSEVSFQDNLKDPFWKANAD